MYPATNTKNWPIFDRIQLLDNFVEEKFPGYPILSELLGTDYFSSPASTKYHGSYPGGLFDHCMNVTKTLLYMTEAHLCTPWENPCSPLIVGMLHDLTKVGKYSYDEETKTVSWNNKGVSYGGHGADSVIKAQRLLNLTEEETLCIRYHMGAYEKEDWEGFDKAIKLYPNVLWTHMADMYASKRMEE